MSLDFFFTLLSIKVGASLDQVKVSPDQAWAQSLWMLTRSPSSSSHVCLYHIPWAAYSYGYHPRGQLSDISLTFPLRHFTLYQYLIWVGHSCPCSEMCSSHISSRSQCRARGCHGLFSGEILFFSRTTALRVVHWLPSVF